ncbi:MAG: hypothetical protein HOW73_41330 [Polyangiaceae bacterium]|nr:hypothetical protein [Polyangiaceae bacterium]
MFAFDRRLRVCLFGVAFVAACGDSEGTGASAGSSSGGSSSTSGGSGPGGSTQDGGGGSTGTFNAGGADAGPVFPEEPIVEAGAPANASELFGDPGSGAPTGGPCLYEPELGALLPKNWLRPRFSYAPGAEQNLFEIRFHAESEPSDLVVYTTQSQWTMPEELWADIAPNVQDEPITVTIRGAVFDGTAIVGEPTIGSQGPITIAPVAAEGAIVYWTTSGGSSLKGFKVGDESVVSALAPAQVQMPTTGGPVTCVGCHTSTPDGKYASFVAQGPWSNVIGSIEEGTVGQRPPFLGAGAEQFLTAATDLGIHTYSKGHYDDGDHIMVTPSGAYANAELIWVDLEATQASQGSAWGVFARDGDARGVGSPAWSHDGETIVYVSSDAELTGRLDVGPADLYSIEYNDRQGGPATPLAGAATAEWEEYYPALSPDDTLTVFNRIPDGQNMYNAGSAELFVIPTIGGEPVRLAANDPPTCTAKTSPGVTNSWPKWSPEAKQHGGRTYYWVIFSSTRSAAGNPQLYITAVVKDGTNITTYPALYLWNQPPGENNHTPAWDVFEIPPVPPPG